MNIGPLVVGDQCDWIGRFDTFLATFENDLSLNLQPKRVGCFRVTFVQSWTTFCHLLGLLKTVGRIFT